MTLREMDNWGKRKRKKEAADEIIESRGKEKEE